MAEIWYNPKGGGSAVNFAGCSMKPPILVVDDDPVIRETVSRKLEAAGYEVITAADASEAIAAIGHHAPEVILLDINLPAEPPYGGGPRWDGLQLMSWLRTLRGAQRARFIIITGLDLGKVRLNLMETPTIAFMQKPIDFDLLLATLAEAQGEDDRVDGQFP